MDDRVVASAGDIRSPPDIPRRLRGLSTDATALRISEREPDKGPTTPVSGRLPCPCALHRSRLHPNRLRPKRGPLCALRWAGGATRRPDLQLASGRETGAESRSAPYHRPLSNTRPPQHENSVGACCVQRMAQ